MTDRSRSTAPRLVDSLARVARRHAIARKLVVAPHLAAGRELLRRYALTHGGWIGFEVTTPGRLALRLARPAMEEAGVVLLDAFEQQAILDQAIDAVLPAEGGRFRDLSEGLGFRTRVREGVGALRLAGIASPALERARLGDWRKRRFLLRVLQRYERALAEGARADTATVLELGAAALDQAGGLPDSLEADLVLLLPGLGLRGLAGRFVGALQDRGAKVLETDPVFGLAAPDRVLWNRGKTAAPGSRLFDPDGGAEGEGPPLEIDVFRAASMHDEVREVIRRVVALGLRWDDVEIVTPDPAAYGSVLHAVSTRLAIPVTYAVGLPLARTRAGRVVAAYLDWVEEGFQAAPIRRLLEAGDLRPRGGRGPSPAALARRFRSLRIGWGRSRYRAQIRAALAAVANAERAGEGPGVVREERERERARRELRAIRWILFPTLRATPRVPDRPGSGGAPVAPAEIASGLKAFLRSVPRGRGPDRAAREHVLDVLDRVEATLHRRTDFRAAVASLRGHLQLRVRVERLGDDADAAGAPWSSEGGALHVTDLEHGGYSGRRTTFLVGLDADRFPGGGGQDPVLLDADRRVLGDDLPTSAEILHERLFRAAALFARLRGRVTLSYPAWGAADGRTASPSSLLLRALRLARGDASISFEDLDRELGPVVSPVPRGTTPLLDCEDVWLAALDAGGVLRSGEAAVRAAFPRLDRGLVAASARVDGDPGPVHGIVEARADLFDPRRVPEMVMSASRLEGLGRCPLRYLHQGVLKLHAPDDPELDPDRWLDPLRKGNLLHAVYEASLRRARGEGAAYEDARFEALALEELAKVVERARREIPVPGDGALAREVASLGEDVRSFVRMVRTHGADWSGLEVGFGYDEPFSLELGGGAVRVRGKIDRIDADLVEGVRVVDYKTGAARDLGADHGAFHGGRRLQLAIYARVAAARFDAAEVAGEYHFPTRRGENQRFAFEAGKLQGLESLLDLMLDGVGKGTFVPTDSADDCAFCDYAEICRARRSDWGKVHSPLADWAEERIGGLDPAFATLKAVRAFEG